MWQIIRTKRDFLFLLNGFSVVIIISCGYGLVENYLQYNPLADYEATLNNDISRNVNFTYNIDGYRGYRIKSIFDHAIGAGVIWALAIMTYSYTWFDDIYKKNFQLACIVPLCLVCLFLTKSRGPILFLLIASIGLFKLGSSRFYVLLSFAVLLVVLGWNFWQQFADNFLSIFSSQFQEKVGGSDAEQRYSQLEAAFMLMEKSWLIGLGYKYEVTLSGSMAIIEDRLLGHEGIWFTVLPQFGILGIIANLYLMYYSIFKLPSKTGSRMLLFVALAYWITASLTSLPGFKSYYYYFFLILIIKNSRKPEIKLDSNQKEEIRRLLIN